MPSICLQCSKRKEDCCISDYAKFTTIKDAIRISEFLKKPINEIVIFSKLSKSDKKTDLHKKKIHSYYYDLVSKDGEILQLRRKKDGSCFYLTKKGRCMIYETRPLVCRTYPFWFSRDGEIIIDHNGLGCDIVLGKIGSNHKIKREHEAKIFSEFSCSKERVEEILSQLKEEIEDYKKNVEEFVQLNDIKPIS